jgi:hypothetical protein
MHLSFTEYNFQIQGGQGPPRAVALKKKKKNFQIHFCVIVVCENVQVIMSVFSACTRHLKMVCRK